jgi:hypothetical protein
MEIFNPHKLNSRNSKLYGELFENISLDLPLTLRWKISMHLDDFQIGNFTIHNPEIELGSFTLPYISISQKFDKTKRIIKSWKELPNCTFDFSNSFIDNIGSIYYNIQINELDNEWKNNVFEIEPTEFFDNAVEIHQIEFGELNQNKIRARLTIQIHFNSFNMQEPPFGKEFYCNIFDIEVELEIKEVKLLDTSIPVRNILEAQTISEKALQLNDYVAECEKKQVFVSLTEQKDRMHFTFEPKY